MEKYTYTNMRTELSDVLDKLRKGESITITQRGKEDLVLRGSSANTIALNDEVGELTDINHIDKILRLPGLREADSVCNLPGQKIMQSSVFKTHLKAVSEIQRAIPGLTPKFLKALTLTQIKHADTIKKLEDN